MQRGEIVLGLFPFGDMTGNKVRPLLLLTGPVGSGMEIVAAYISSVIPPSLRASDILLDAAQPQHRSTGLKVVSVLRLHKIGTIHTSNVRRYIGSLSPATQQEVDAKLRVVLNL